MNSAILSGKNSPTAGVVKELFQLVIRMQIVILPNAG